MLCYNCFKEYEGDLCPYCGYDPGRGRDEFPSALRPGTVLKDTYVVGRVLGQGGFGITYAGWDRKNNRLAAIKEFFPDGYSGREPGSTLITPHSGSALEFFDYGKKSFYEEAQNIYKFAGNPNVVQVYAFFEENNTAYIVMEYIKGRSLEKIVKSGGGRISVAEADAILLPLLDVLTAIHSHGIIHRDLAPDNVIVTPEGVTKLIDFGASRFSIGEKTQTLTMILKHGYAPIEQYQSKGHQGPYTDLYAFAAMYYQTVTGQLPSQSVDRIIDDTVMPPSSYGVDLGPKREAALMKALAVQAKDRYQTVPEFKADFGAANDERQTENAFDAVYSAALSDMERGRYKEARDKFLTISMWKDAGEKIRQCENAMAGKDPARAGDGNSGVPSYPVNKSPVKEPSPEAGREAEKREKQKKNTKKIVMILAAVAACAALMFAVLALKNSSGKKTEYDSVNVGDIVTLGKYEQDNNLSNGSEDIEWIVLEKKDGKLLVISRYALDAKQYNEEFTAITWEECSLRNWLNNDFFSSAFNDKEKKLIAATVLPAEKSPNNTFPSGNDTEDRVFILNENEAFGYFSTNEERQCRPTEYAKAQKAYVDPNGNGRWWLRSFGIYSSFVAYVESTGDVEPQGNDVSLITYSVRPAMWINIEEGQSSDAGNPVQDLEPAAEGAEDDHPLKSLSECAAGDLILFGRYNQTGKAASQEDIEWLVLERQGDRVLVISRYAIEAGGFNKESSSTTWETCSLRTQLNRDFYSSAFSASEQNLIVLSTVTAEPNPDYPTDPGHDTQDHIFLLSLEEAERYFSSDKERQCEPTYYAVKHGAAVDQSSGTVCWWLRTPGKRSDSVAGVREDGSICVTGYLADTYRTNSSVGQGIQYGIRPAMWLEIPG